MKKQLILGLSLLTFSFGIAQEPAQYIHFNAGGGLHKLMYDMPNGLQKGKAGYTLNGAYSYFFTSQWGVQAGLGIQSFGSQSALNYFTATADTDADNDDYTLRTLYTNWQEKQHAFMFNIPVALQYRHLLNQKFSLIGSAGVQLSIPLSAKYKSAGGEITTTGYYPTWNVELSDIPEQGFSTTTDIYQGKISLKPSVMSTLDLGALYRLNDKTELYVGAYFNYGLGKIEKPNTKLIYQKDGTYNGMFASNQIANVRPMAFGLKVGLYLQIGKQKQVVDIVEIPQIVEPTIVEEAPVEVVIVEETPIIEEAPVVVETPKPVIEAPVVAPPKVEPKPVDAFKEAQKTASALKIRFDLNSNQPISKMDNDKLKSLIKYLQSNPNTTLQIIGHTCNTGSRRNNMILGTKRAIEVQQKLIQSGAPKAQLMTLSKAYDEPLVPNTTDANRKLNRRVEFRLIRK
jgi:outer membrane protein OmpA-like peptidoglycan-associated protein